MEQRYKQLNIIYVFHVLNQNSSAKAKPGINGHL